MTLAQLAFGPFGILNMLRGHFYVPVAVTLLVRCALLAPRGSLIYESTAAITTVTAAAVLLLVIILDLMIDTKKFGALQTEFDNRPWVNSSYFYRSKPTDTGTRKVCPFTQNSAKGTCPVCCTCTSVDGYYHGDPYVLHELLGANMIEYRMAEAAAERNDNPVMGRIELDTLIQYKGNYVFGTLSPSCKGCYFKTWCWNVACRMVWQSAILACNLMISSYLFKGEITIFYVDLKNILLCASFFFTSSTVCMIIYTISTSIVFVMEHPFMDKKSIPQFIDINNAAIMEWVYYFAEPSAKFGVNPSRTYWGWLNPKTIPAT